MSHGAPGLAAHATHPAEVEIQPPRAGTSRTRSARRLFHAFPQQGELPLKIVCHAKGVAALKKAGLVTEQRARAEQCAQGTLLTFQAAQLPAALLADLLRIKADSLR